MKTTTADLNKARRLRAHAPLAIGRRCVIRVCVVGFGLSGSSRPSGTWWLRNVARKQIALDLPRIPDGPIPGFSPPHCEEPIRSQFRL